MTRLPRKIPLPNGYDVTVVRGDCGDAWGEWDETTRTITIDPTLKPAEARFILWGHEIDHAWADWKKWMSRTVGMQNPDGPADEPAEGDTDA